MKKINHPVEIARAGRKEGGARRQVAAKHSRLFFHRTLPLFLELSRRNVVELDLPESKGF
jgi:hypothetical protein